MLALSRWKLILVALSLLFGLLFTLPNLVPTGTLPAWLPGQRLNLGLDLQGGSYLLLEVDTAALKKERLTNLTEDVRTKLQSAQIDFSGLGLTGESISVRITDPAKIDAARKLLNDSLGERLATGGKDVVLRTASDQRIVIDFVSQAADAAARDAVSRSIEIIRKRIDALGTKEPIITQQGATRIVVEAPGESDPEKLKAVIGKTAKLTFQMVDTEVAPEDVAAGRIPPDDEQLVAAPGLQGPPSYVVKRRSVVTGEMLTAASAGHDQDNQPDINFGFNGAGSQRFATTTSENIGKPFAIVLDKQVISAPRINSAIVGGTGQITGSFTEESGAQSRAPAQVGRSARAADRAAGTPRRGGARRRRGESRNGIPRHRRGGDLRLHHPGLWTVRDLRGRRSAHQRADAGRRHVADPGHPDLAGYRRPDPDHGRGRRRQRPDL